MADEISIWGLPTGMSLYCLTKSTGKTVALASNGTTETLTPSRWTLYKIGLTEITGTGIYFASLPTGMSTATHYDFPTYQQLGGSAAITDTFWGMASFDPGFPGGPVASVTDRTGFALASTGLNAIMIGPLTLPRLMQAIGAESVGIMTISNNGNTIQFAMAGDPATNVVTATVDHTGRTALTLVTT